MCKTKSWTLLNNFKCSWRRTVSAKNLTKSIKKITESTVLFLLLHAKIRLALYFPVEPNGTVSTDFWEKKAVALHYYIGLGYKFFMDEARCTDIYKNSETIIHKTFLKILLEDISYPTEKIV